MKEDLFFAEKKQRILYFVRSSFLIFPEIKQSVFDAFETASEAMVHHVYFF